MFMFYSFFMFVCVCLNMFGAFFKFTLLILVFKTFYVVSETIGSGLSLSLCLSLSINSVFYVTASFFKL